MDNLDKEKTEKILWRFVSAVENGEDIPEQVLEYIALGVLNYLKGGVPWPEKQGRKPKQETEKIKRAAKIELTVELIKQEYDIKITNKKLSEFLKCSPKTIFRIKEDAKKFSQEPGPIPNWPKFLNDYTVAKAKLMCKFDSRGINILEDLIENFSKDKKGT